MVRKAGQQSAGKQAGATWHSVRMLLVSRVESTSSTSVTTGSSWVTWSAYFSRCATQASSLPSACRTSSILSCLLQSLFHPGFPDRRPSSVLSAPVQAVVAFVTQLIAWHGQGTTSCIPVTSSSGSSWPSNGQVAYKDWAAGALSHLKLRNGGVSVGLPDVGKGLPPLHGLGECCGRPGGRLSDAQNGFHHAW